MSNEQKWSIVSEVASQDVPVEVELTEAQMDKVFKGSLEALRKNNPLEEEKKDE